MQGHKSLLTKLENHERVRLTPKGYRKKIKGLFIFLLILSAAIITAIIYFYSITFTTLGVSFGVLLITLLAIRQLSKFTMSTTIKGDNIILKTLNDKAIVTSLRSVGHIRSKNFLGIRCTTFRYNLDGQYRSTLIINSGSHLPCSAASLLNKAIERCKKQKANNKLGSVSA